MAAGGDLYLRVMEDSREPPGLKLERAVAARIKRQRRSFLLAHKKITEVSISS
jgi:hypothetical protein